MKLWWQDPANQIRYTEPLVDQRYRLLCTASDQK